MKSIKIKLLLPVFFMFFFFLGLMVVQYIHIDDNLKSVKEMKEKSLVTLSLAEKLKLDVVQVQQWVTDISATRAAKGFDDGFTEAEKYAQDAKAVIKELEKINPEKQQEFDKIEKEFDPYYETGKEMAKAYIEGGPGKGNLSMEQFDSAAEAINSAVDTLKSDSNKNIENSIKNIENSIFNTVIVIAISIGITIIISIIAWIYVSRAIVDPIRNMLSKLKDISSNGGDLTKHIDFSSKDEIGEMAKYFNLMQGSFRKIIQTIISESTNVQNKVDKTNENIDQLSMLIGEVSSTTEGLSSQMEEMSASTEEMSASAFEIEGGIESIATNAQEGNESSSLIRDRAKELRSKAIYSKETAKKVNEATQIKLLNAIERSKEVEKINALSKTILQITSQTNLLALNASIEAARAGEAGKGFTVVAEEIRKLAENSKTAASQIQNVTQVVIGSVENLVSTSEEMLGFITNEVIRDYDMIVKTGEQYNDDAIMINNMTDDFSEKSKEIANSMQAVVISINDIVEANGEVAAGTSGIAEKIITISEKSNNVVKLATEVSDSTSKLFQMVSKFKV